MTVVEICVSAYLIVAIPATVLIWSALAASKRRQDKAQRLRTSSFVKYQPIQESNTGPSRLHP